MAQCEWIGEAGTPCIRQALAGDLFCGEHRYTAVPTPGTIPGSPAPSSGDTSYPIDIVGGSVDSDEGDDSGGGRGDG